MQIVFGVLSVASGSFVTWLVTRFYYRRAAKDLQQETERVRALICLVIDYMEKAGLEIKRDDSGYPVAYRLTPIAREHIKVGEWVQVKLGPNSERENAVR